MPAAEKVSAARGTRLRSSNTTAGAGVEMDYALRRDYWRREEHGRCEGPRSLRLVDQEEGP